MTTEMRSRDLSEFTIGTLASLTVARISLRIDSTRLNGAYVKDYRYNVDWFGKTAGANEGPILYGLVAGMTDAEVAAVFAADPQSREDDVAIAESKEHIVVHGVVGQSTTESGNSNAAGLDRMRNGKWYWPIIEGESLQHFVFNRNPVNAMATGMILSIYSECYGGWLRD